MDGLKKEFTLGLDIGTNSVGWAVIDENNDLVKKYGHYLWGVRMFDKSLDAKDRRIKRCQRRRYQRRRERIELLRNLFQSEIDKVDSNFFKKLDESFYKEEDSTVKNKNIFENFLSSSEINKYYGPTIWHLRKYIINHPNEKIDVRLLYLAIHHIIKYRGNFLSQVNDFNINDCSLLETNLENFNNFIISQREAYCDILGSDNSDSAELYLKSIESKIDSHLISQIEDIIEKGEIFIDGKVEPNKTKSDKKKHLVTLLNGKGTVLEGLFAELLITGKCNFEKLKLFNWFAEKPDFKIDFSMEDFDTFISEKFRNFPNEYNLLNAVIAIKNLYESFYLKKLIGDNRFISFAMVEKYNQYKKDLSDLKILFKKYSYDRYTLYFRNKVDKYDNYVAFSGSTNYNSKKKHIKDKCTRISEEKFFNQLKKELKDIKDSITSTGEENLEDLRLCSEIESRIDEGTFLQRIRSKHNGVLPYQLHEVELKAILDNQSKFYSFLNQGEPTAKFKILTLLKFKRPYFIGPIAGHGDNKWAVFKDGKENERAYPWNFEEVVDYDASASEFIRRMQNKCTYLKGEKDYCLPKYSIIYQTFNVLNYINKIKVNGRCIDDASKQKVLDLFLSCKNVTAKRIKSAINPINPEQVIASECNTSLSTYVTINENIPEFHNLIKENIDLIEDIIESVALFEDKQMLEKRIRDLTQKYNVTLSEDSIKKIRGFNFKGYGRLCKKLLKEIPFINKKTGEHYQSVIQFLFLTTHNFMEALSEENFTFSEEIDDYNRRYSTLINLSEDEESFKTYVNENLMISPIWIRPFIQSFKIVQEVEKILGQKISYYAVECTREEDAKNKNQRSVERKDQIMQLYKAAEEFKNELTNASINLDALESKLKTKDNLREDKLFLYFQQMGKDMYTLEDIDINELSTQYDIDHIYPQSLVKDDSLSNRVLTRKTKNNFKQNKLLPDLASQRFLAKNAYKFYELLYKNKMITKTKYERLTEKEVDEVAINNFVARQKTATDQAVKALMQALKDFKHVETTHIIYSKASIVSDFRKANYIYKSREANNYHHAHDAYLNAFLGKTLQKYFNAIGSFANKDYRPEIFYEGDKDDSQYTRNVSKILGSKTRYLAHNHDIVWNGTKDLLKIKKTIQEKFDIRETTYTIRKNTFISQVTIGGKNSKKNVPIKSKTPNGNVFDMNKYGGYTAPAYMYMQIFECIDKKGKYLINWFLLTSCIL